MARLAKIVLHFDDGTTHEVDRRYSAVYRNAERARRANEKGPPWDKPPHERGSNAGNPDVRDMGKDDSSNDLDPQRCYEINGTIICP
ncbi:MAG TPA: hypothetical protein VFU06_09440 [Longimicrobiales bacterium]|nr:hypothetical protein [Longimicrobiales bacterium]